MRAGRLSRCSVWPGRQGLWGSRSDSKTCAQLLHMAFSTRMCPLTDAHLAGHVLLQRKHGVDIGSQKDALHEGVRQQLVVHDVRCAAVVVRRILAPVVGKVVCHGVEAGILVVDESAQISFCSAQCQEACA